MRWIWITIGYAFTMVAVLAGMFQTRSWALSNLATAQSLAEWESWRADVQEQQGKKDLLVERRVPKSSEPPGLVLMRDHFAISLLGAVLFSSMLYWVLAWFIIGVVKHSKPVAMLK